MREIAIISGKGGTGKTALAASLLVMTPNAVGADADVDAANLSLLMSPVLQDGHDFFGERKPVVDAQRCTGCGRCWRACRWQAIGPDGVNFLACEGCGVCGYLCSEEAICLEPVQSGRWFVSTTAHGPLVHAELLPGAGNSGKLVTLVRQQALQLARAQGRDWVFIDGPPGTGCPVIASLTGVKAALVVTEPSQSGLHDLERVVGLCQHFSLTPYVCINRYDLSLAHSQAISEWCQYHQIPETTRIPYDPQVLASVVAGSPPVLAQGSRAASAMRGVWAQLTHRLTNAPAARLDPEGIPTGPAKQEGISLREGG